MRLDFETDPSAFSGARVQLRAGWVVHPHLFAEVFQAQQVWRRSVQRLPRGDPTECPRRRAVFQPRRMAQRLAPHVGRECCHV
jgi:hypothetical protein